MNHSEIVIEEVARSECAWQRNIRFGPKLLQTPAQVMLIEKQTDLRPLIVRNDLESMPQGLATSLGTAHLLPPARQAALPGFSLGDHHYETIRGNVPTFFDPDTDIFYDGREADREEYAKAPEIPHAAMIEKLRSDTYNAWWARLHADGKLLALLMWSARRQVAQDADAILPYSPYLDGDSTQMADIAVAANAQTRTLVASMRPGREAAYYNFHTKAFKKVAVTDRVLAALEKDVLGGTPPRLFIVKLTDPNGNDAVINYRIRAFFQRVNELKEMASMNGTPFGVGFIGPVGRGAALVFAGVDFFVESFGPSARYARSKKGVAPPRHGRYYHPGVGFRDFVGFEELLGLYEANGRTLPCPCSACQRLAGIGLPVNDEDEWNAVRRVHFVNARRRELEMFVKAIREGTAHEAINWVGTGNNAHYGNWLQRQFV